MDILQFIQDNAFLMSLLVAGVGMAITFILQVRDLRKERDLEKIKAKEEKEKMEGKIHELHTRLHAIETTRMEKIDTTQKEQGDLLLTIKGDIKGMGGTLNARLDGIDKLLKLMQGNAERD